MSDYLSKKALLEWGRGLHTIPEAIPNRSEWTRGFDRALERFEEEVQSGRFDLTSPADKTTLGALEGHDTFFLGKIATILKQSFGGEGWAVGEMVERAILNFGQRGTIALSPIGEQKEDTE